MHLLSLQLPGPESTLSSTLAVVLTLLYRELMKDPVRLREGLRELVRHMKEEETETTLKFMKQLLELTRRAGGNNRENDEEDYAKKLDEIRPIVERFSGAMHLSGWIEAITESLPPRRGYIVRMAIVAVLSSLMTIFLTNGIATFNVLYIMIGSMMILYLAIMFHEAYNRNSIAEKVCNMLYQRAEALKYNYNNNIERVKSYARFCLKSEESSRGREHSRESRSSQ